MGMKIHAKKRQRISFHLFLSARDGLYSSFLASFQHKITDSTINNLKGIKPKPDLDFFLRETKERILFKLSENDTDVGFFGVLNLRKGGVSTTGCITAAASV